MYLPRRAVRARARRPRSPAARRAAGWRSSSSTTARRSSRPAAAGDAVVERARQALFAVAPAAAGPAGGIPRLLSGARPARRRRPRRSRSRVSEPVWRRIVYRHADAGGPDAAKSRAWLDEQERGRRARRVRRGVHRACSSTARRGRLPRAVRRTLTLRPSRTRVTSPARSSARRWWLAMLGTPCRSSASSPAVVGLLEAREDQRALRSRRAPPATRAAARRRRSAPGLRDGVADRQADVAVVVGPARRGGGRDQRVQDERRAGPDRARPALPRGWAATRSEPTISAVREAVGDQLGARAAGRARR